MKEVNDLTKESKVTTNSSGGSDSESTAQIALTKEDLIAIYKNKDNKTNDEKYSEMYNKLGEKNKKNIQVAKAIRADLMKGVLPELITNAFSFVAIISSFILGFLSKEFDINVIFIPVLLIIAYAFILVIAPIWLKEDKYVLQVVNDYLEDNKN